MATLRSSRKTSLPHRRKKWTPSRRRWPPLGKKGKAKKAKTGQKAAGTSYQWQALEKMGIPSNEIAAFAEPYRWLDYFPPYGVSDLKKFGASIDWRRSFVTTDKNPYYDSFVQMAVSEVERRRPHRVR